MKRAVLSIHFLMDKLFQLQKRLKHTGTNETGMNVIEAYNHFVNTSDKGRTCTYALKCKELFINQDLKEIKQLLEETLELINEEENKDIEN